MVYTLWIRKITSYLLSPLFFLDKDRYCFLSKGYGIFVNKILEVPERQNYEKVERKQRCLRSYTSITLRQLNITQSRSIRKATQIKRCLPSNLGIQDAAIHFLIPQSRLFHNDVLNVPKRFLTKIKCIIPTTTKYLSTLKWYSLRKQI